MLRLDQACPIAWKSAHASTSSDRVGLSGSPTSKTCSSPESIGRPHQIDAGSSVLRTSGSNTNTHSDETRETSNSNKNHSTSNSIKNINSESQLWLHRRYHETLWLSEEHSPLSAFLQHLHRFRRIGKSTSTVQELISSFSTLLRSRPEIRKRFTAAAASHSAASLESLVKTLSSSQDERLGREEERIIHMALESGPGSLVAAEMRKESTEEQRPGKMTRLWLQAMESREVQMQILVVLHLLHLSTLLPSISATTSSRVTEEMERQQDSETKRRPFNSIQMNINGDACSAKMTTKRKRKTDHATRWTGGGGVAATFPWAMQQNSRDGHASTYSRLESSNKEDNKCTDLESLSKRFETLLDSLSLQIFTCNLGLDLQTGSKEAASPKQSPLTQQKTSKGYNNRSGDYKEEQLQPWQMFGSEGRRRQRQKSKEGKDVLQWMCCNIVEPHFSKTLPRQCGIIRAKCFVPGSGTTPAKSSRREREQQEHQQQRMHARTALDEGQRGRRSLSRSHSQSPVPWSLPREEEEGSSQMDNSLRGKWDARQVSVRKKWDRSPSIDATTLTQGTAALGPTVQRPSFAERSRSVQLEVRPPLSTRESSSLSSSSSGRVTADQSVIQGKSQRESSQLLVTATPSKSYPSNARKSSSSSSSSSSSFPSQSASAASLSAWRRTESQPVILTSSMMDDAEDAAEEQVIDSLVFDESDEEEEEEEGEAIKTYLSLPKRHDGDQQEGKCMSLMDSAQAVLPQKALLHRSESQPVRSSSASILSQTSDSEDEDDEKREMIIAKKKRRTLAPSLSFALLNNAPKPSIGARNPFAIA